MLLSATTGVLVAVALANPAQVVVLPHDGSSYARYTSAGQPNYAPREALARAFYQTHSDSYDFLVVFPTFAGSFGAEALGLHSIVRNKTTGIGQPPIDMGASFGSPSRLLSVIDLAALSLGPVPPRVDETLSVLAHEVAHQWSGQARFKDAATGQASQALLGQEGAHWSYFLDSEASVLYGARWKDNGNGSFTAVETRRRYSALDLYLMGFLSPLEVPPFSLIVPAPGGSHTASDLPPPSGTTQSGTMSTVRVDDVIAVEGPRAPDFASAPHVFRAAFIVLAPSGQQPTPAQLAFVDQVRVAWASEFFFLTRGRGVMETDLVEAPPSSVSQSPTVAKGLDYLLARQGADGGWADGPMTTVRESEEALEALALFGTDTRVPSASAKGGAFLQALTPAGTDAAARRALGLMAANLNRARVAPLLALDVGLAMLSPEGGLGEGLGYSPSPIDSVLAGQALVATGASPQELAPLTAYLLAQQAGDGGWAFTPGGPSRIEPTARVLDYLARLPKSATVLAAVGKAIGFLQGQRRPDGSFVDDGPTPAATAFAILGMASWDRLSFVEARGAAQALLSAQLADGSWGGSVHQTAEALRALRVVLTPNLTVGAQDLSLAKSAVTDGETVSMMATVRNTGFASTGPVVVKAFDSNGVPFGPGQTIPMLDPGASAQVSLLLDTTGHVGSNQVFFVVDPDGLVDEARKDDNRAALALVVSPPPQAVDLFAVAGSVSSAPLEITRLPTTFTVTAVVGNLGQTAAVGVPVALQVAGVTVGSVTVDLPARSRRPVSFQASVTTAPGSAVALTVLVDPSGQVPETRKDNNSASGSVPVRSVIDVGVVDLLLSPATVSQGNDLTIAYTLQNFGTVDASGAIAKLTIPGAGGLPAMVLPTASFTIPAGGTVSGQGTWRANVAGTQTIQLAVTARGDVNPANDTRAATATVLPSALANLFVPVGGLTVSPTRPLQSVQATATANIGNGGAADAGSFLVDFFLGDPGDGGVRFSSQRVAGLAAGGSQVVSAAFTATSAAPTSVAVVLDSTNQVLEFDKRDNVAVLAISPASIADLVLGDGDVQPAEAFPRQGQVVPVDVSVFNSGAQDATQVSVELFQGAPETGGSLIGSQVFPKVAAGARQHATFQWSTANIVGAQTLVAIANRAKSATESRYDNNRGQRQLVVQNGALALSNPYFSPNGDGVKDTTEVFYRLSQADAVQVDVRDANGKLVRTLKAAPALSGSLAWDGLDDAGHLLRDGKYQVTVLSGQAGSGVLLGTLTAVVDTNRTPLEDPTGASMIVMENLSPHRPITHSSYGRRPLAPAADSTGVVMYSSRTLPTGVVDCGFFFQPNGDEEPIQLTPASWDCSREAPREPSTSLDGKIVYVASVDCSPPTYYLCSAIRMFDPATQLFRTLVLGDSGPTWRNVQHPVLSADGAKVAFSSNGNAPNAGLEVIDVSGANRRGLGAPNGIIRELAFSPDGRRLSYMSETGWPHMADVGVVPVDGSAAPSVLAHDSFHFHASEGPRHAWLAGGHEIAFVIDRAGLDAVSVDTGARRVLYRATSDETWQFRRDTSLAVSPVTGVVGYTGHWDTKIATVDPLSGSRRVLVSSRDGAPLYGLGWSPAGNFMFAGAGWWGEYRAVTTLANLGIRVSASRAVGSSSLDVAGTATDVNFDSYELSVAPLGSAGAATVVAQSQVPVVGGLLAQWVPPSAGVYDAIVTAHDKAGNVRRRKMQVAWSDTPAIANLTRSPEYISPNGDGVQDVTNVGFSVTAPVSAAFIVRDPLGAAVRHIMQTYLQAGPGALTWDGRNDVGVTVRDDAYLLQVEGAATRVVVDTAPPSVSFGFSNYSTTSLDGGLAAYVPPHPPSPLSALVPEPFSIRLEPAIGVGVTASDVPRIRISQSWRATDANLADWSLEETQPSAPGAFVTVESGSSQDDVHDSVLISAVRGRARRLSARDQAGNVAATIPNVPPERLFVTAVGDATAVGPSKGSIIVDGVQLPRIDLLTPIFTSAGDPRKFSFTPKEYAFALESSVGQPLVGFAVVYYPLGSSAQVVDQSHVSAMSDRVLVWDARTVPPGAHDIAVRATDALGRTFFAKVDFSSALSVQLAPKCFEVSGGGESAVFSVQLSGNPAVGLAPGVSLEFERAGAVEQSFVLPELLFLSDGAGVREAEARVDASLLSHCAYHPVLTGSTTDGTPFRAEFVGGIDVCGSFLAEAAPNSSGALLTVGHTYRSPVTSMDVTLRDGAGTTARPVGTVGPLAPFPALASLRAPAATPWACTDQFASLTAHLPDGSTNSGLLDLCAPLKPMFSVGCGSVTLRPGVRDLPGPLCTPHAPTFTVPIEASAEPGATITSLAASVETLGGQALASLPVLGFTPGPSVTAKVSVATAGLPEGKYLIRAVAMSSTGSSMTGVMAPSDAIVVDHTPPLVSVTSPIAGALVCQTQTRNSNGTMSSHFTVSGVVQDAFLEQYAVNLRNANGAPFIAGEKTFPLPAAAQSVSGPLLDVDSSHLAGGDYQVFLSARDVSGGSACSAPVTFHLSDGVRVTGAVATPFVFSPDGDGVLDTTSVAFTLDEAASVSASATGSAATPGVFAGASMQAGSRSVTWNGSGAPDGDYQVLIQATDGCGHPGSQTVAVRIDTTPPGALIRSPLPASVQNTALAVYGEASDANLKDYELALGAGAAPTTFATVATATSSASGLLGVIDLSTVSPGPYAVRLLVRDVAGHQSVAQVAFKVGPHSLIQSLSASPTYFSPVVTGSASVSFALVSPAVANVQFLDATGRVAGVALQPTALPAGPQAVAVGPSLPDGDYRVLLTASAGAVIETASTALTVDSVPPTLAISSPASGAFVPGSADVTGSIADLHLQSWTLLHEAPGVTAPATTASGTTSSSGSLSALRGLADGTHAVVLRGVDRAGNRAETRVTFTSDSTPPALAFVSPLDGSVIDGKKGPLAVNASLVEANLRLLTLTASMGAPGSPPVTLFSSGTFPANGHLTDWNVGAVPDGPATLRLVAVDRAGLSAQRDVSLLFDSTPPTAVITSPAGSWLTSAPGLFQGTADDATLEHFTLSLSDGPPATASRFVAFNRGTTPVISGELGRLATLPADGQYTVRLEVFDRAGHVSTALAGFNVDTHPPAAPTGLTAQVVARTDVRLTWSPSPSPDVASYVLLRASGTGALVPLTTVPATSTSFTDQALADGTYRYAVAAVDAAGLKSPATPEARALIDTVPPTTVISRPLPGDRLRGVVDVTGIAFKFDGFVGYELSVGQGVAPVSFTVLRTSAVPVPTGLLGTLDTGLLPEGSVQTLRLVARDARGNVGESRATVIIDNVPPAPPVLLTATAAGANVTVTWRQSPEPDLAGYLLYRNGALVNAPPGTSFPDITPFLLPPSSTSYSDLGVPDGVTTYQLQAVDLAHGFSGLSNTLSVTLDNRAPVATVVSPLHLARVSGLVQVVVDTPDRDIATIQVQVRAGAAPSFTALGPALTRFPYVTTLDPAAFPSPVLELRAVATDLGGKTDASPASIVVFAAGALRTPVVAAHVDAQTSTLSWTHPNAPGSVVGFELRRDGFPLTGNPFQVTGGTASASSTSAGTPSSVFGTYGSWTSAPGASHQWQADFSAPALVRAVDAYPTGAQTVQVSVRAQGVWVKVAPTPLGAVSGAVSVPLSPPLLVDGLRLDLVPSTPGNPVGLNYAGASAVPLLTSPPFIDSSLWPATYTYAVSLRGSFGQSATATAGAHVYAPVLNQPASPVGTSSVTLQGTQAEANATVDILRGGVSVAHAAADALGAFSVTVPLVPGPNALFARATDALGNLSIPSSPVSVVLDSAPSAVLSLSLSGVTGADVSLAFTATGNLAGISGFEVRRASGGTQQAVAALAPADRSFTDRGLANGAYSYTVVALNGSGFAGAPSNAVSATVASAVPASPSGLSVTAVAGGAALALQWSFAGPAPQGFRIERATSVAGPFQPVNGWLVQGLSYVDVGLTNGALYAYRVVAVDTYGNAGAPSNVATGTPADTVAPGAPVITEPTDAGHPFVTVAPTVDVGGFAEFGSRVALLQNQQLVGGTLANQPVLAGPSLSTSSPAWYGVALSPDGTTLAYAVTGGFALENVATHAVTVMPLAQVSFSMPAVFSPDGRSLAAEGYSNADRRSHVYVGELATKAFRPVVPTSLGQEHAPAWAPDSRRLAYQAERAGNYQQALAVADVSLGTERVVSSTPNADISSPAWSPDGKSVVAQVSTWWGGTLTTLSRFAVATGARTDLFSAQYIATPFAVSTSKAQAAVTARPAGTWNCDLFLVDLNQGTNQQLTQDAAYEQQPTFSPDGRWLAYLSGGATVLRDLSTGLTTPQPALQGDQLGWSKGGALLLSDRWGLSLLALAGHWTVPAVGLTPGDNVFVATAMDASGNTSPRSLPVTVTFNPSTLADLVVSAVLQPPIPIATQPANALVTVRNLGNAPAVSPEVDVTILTAGGPVRAMPRVTLAGVLAPGGALVTAVPIDVSGLSGPQQLLVVADPSQRIPDAARSNNTVTVPFTVAATDTLALSVTVSPTSVSANGLAVATVTLANPSSPKDLSIQVALTEPDGGVVLVASPDEIIPAFATGASATFSRTVSVGTTLAGPYEVSATARSSGAPVARATAPLTIAPDRATGLTLASSHVSYRSGDDIVLTGRVSNLSQNAFLAGAKYVVELVDSMGVVAFSSSSSLAPLPMGAGASQSTTIPSPGLAPGAYLGRARVELGGLVLATASASLTLVGRPVLAGRLDLQGAVGNPPVVPSGTDAVAAWQLGNGGNASATGVVLHLVLVDPATATPVLTRTVTVGALAAGASASGTERLTTTGLRLATYGLSLFADHDGVSSDLVATARFRVADSSPPSLELLNLTPGMFVRGTVSPVVRALDDFSGTALVRASVDGVGPVPLNAAGGTALDGTWSAALALGADGPHRLTFSARDQEGNDGLVAPTPLNPVSVTIISDTISPQVAITGVIDGALVNHRVAPVVTASDLNLASTLATLDGSPFVSGTVVSADGDHVLSAQATDKAGNQAVAAVRFSIDQTPPRISVFGVTDGQQSRQDLTVGVVISDPHLASSTVTLNGLPFASGTTISQEGDYALAIAAADAAGNSVSLVLTFTIDKTPPTVSLGGFVKGSFVNVDVTPTFSATDAHLLSVDATLDGASFTSGARVTAEATHVLTVTAFDRAGNSTVASGTFTIDKTPPAIVVRGVADGQCSAVDLTPVIEVTDVNLASSTVTLDGQPFVSGTKLTAEADHVLGVSAVDLAGNAATKTVRFSIDRTPPRISVSGVTDGQQSPRDLTVGVVVSDPHLASSTMTLNGRPFTSGKTLVAEGDYSLSVSAIDAAGNAASTLLAFTIDKTPPVVTLGGFAEGSFVNVNVTPTFSATDAHLLSVQASLDGASFASGTLVTSEGKHVLTVTAADRAGNRTVSVGTFTIDKTPPAIVVRGVTDGAFSPVDVIPVVEVTDANLASSTVTLDGQPFVSGTKVTAEASYVLAVSAVDRAGNASSTTVRFTIDKTPPDIVITGVSDGVEYDDTVFPRVTVTDAHLVSSTITLNGAPFVSGTPVELEGSYTLFVQATDAAGNVSTRTVHFTVVPVKYQVGKQLLGTFTRSVALVRSGACGLPAAERSRLEGFLTAAIGGPGRSLVVTWDETTFLSQLRSGVPNTFVVVSLPRDEALCPDGGVGEAHPDQHVDDRWEHELTERVFAGSAGVVVVQAGSDEDELDHVLGLESDHDGGAPGPSVSFSASPLGAVPDLTLAGSAVALTLRTATPAGLYTSSAPPAQVAAAMNVFGLGHAATFGFDLTRASPAPGARLALERAVAQVTPPPGAPGPLSVVGVRIDVTNLARANTTRVRESLAAPLSALDALPGASIATGGLSIEWLMPLGRNDSASLRYWMRMPDQTGTFHTSTEVAAILPTRTKVFGTYGLDVALSQSGGDLLAVAESAAASLPQVGHAADVRAEILGALAKVRSRPVLTRTDIEDNLHDLLEAADEAGELQGASWSAMRLVLDELIRYWEARWFVF